MMRQLTVNEVIELAQATPLTDIRGIMVSDKWETARPVTLAMFLEAQLEAIEEKGAVIWLGDDAPRAKKSEPKPKKTAPAPKKAAEPQKKEEQGPKKETPKDLGRWAEYQGRALTVTEENEVIRGMSDEGYSASRISGVIRCSTQTVLNRRKKMEIEEKGETDEEQGVQGA